MRVSLDELEEDVTEQRLFDVGDYPTYTQIILALIEIARAAKDYEDTKPSYRSRADKYDRLREALKKVEW